MRTTRYPVNDERPERRAKLRLMDVLFSEAPPDPRDIALICLADSWGIIGRVLSQEELDRAMPRIRLLRKMDLIGAAMRRLIEEFDEVFMTLAMRAPPTDAYMDISVIGFAIVLIAAYLLKGPDPK